MISPQDLSFEGKRVLVTGAASGIGAAMARAFDAHGAELVLADRNEKGLEAIHRELGARCRTLVYDQRDLDDVVRLAETAGLVDVLANNAGIVAYGPVVEQEPQAIEMVIQTNLIGPIVLAKSVAHSMLEAGRGVIINTTSQLAFCGASERAVYASAKAGLAQFTRSAAAEWAPHGVRVAAIAPGRTLTPLNERMLSDEEAREKALGTIPYGRFGSAEEMARLVLVLASGVGDYIVGHSLIADGGYVIAQ